MPLEKIDFTQEDELIRLGFEHQEAGPVSTFNKSLDKTEIKKTALETGHIETSFQFAGPFSDSQQKKVRQEMFRVRGLVNIMGDTLTADIESLRPGAQSYRLYAERVMHEAVLVEAARRAAFATAIAEGSPRAALVGRGEGSDDIELCKQLMTESMEALYPKPDREKALNNLGLFHSRLERLMDDERTRGFSERLLADYPFLAEAADRRPEVLRPEKQTEIRVYYESRFDPIFSKVREEIGEIDNDNMTGAVRMVMRELGYLSQGWQVRYVGKERVGLYVDPASRTIEVGERIKPITWAAFERLMIHEVGVHVTRSANAYAKALNTAATGWIGYESAEEALATLSEKAWGGSAAKPDVINRDNYRYIIGVYAAGGIDGQYHSADESFQLAVKLSMLSNLSSQIKKDKAIDLKEAESNARSAVFEHVFRFYRGMPDGLVMIKDISYDTEDMVRRLNQSERPLKEVLDELLRGKYNPFIPLHAEVMDALYDSQSPN